MIGAHPVGLVGNYTNRIVRATIGGRGEVFVRIVVLHRLRYFDGGEEQARAEKSQTRGDNADAIAQYQFRYVHNDSMDLRISVPTTMLLHSILADNTSNGLSQKL